MGAGIGDRHLAGCASAWPRHRLRSRLTFPA
jgi:hypothetical protein